LQKAYTEADVAIRELQQAVSLDPHFTDKHQGVDDNVEGLAARAELLKAKLGDLYHKWQKEVRALLD
jgi:hypothetical protein